MINKKSGRGPKISNGIRQLIISQAIHDSKIMPRRALAVRLQELIERMGEVSPTEDTLMRMISEARNKQPSELEKPWCIGACTYYNIPHDMIPVLIKIQKLKAENGDDEDLSRVLTVREAQWIARLYHVAEPLIRGLPEPDENRLLWLDFIANSYVKRERVSQQMNESYPNTYDLDKLYFYSEKFLDMEIMIPWWDSLMPSHKQAIIKAIENERADILESTEQYYKRPLTPEEIKMIDGCFESLKKGGLVTLREFINQTPLAKENGMKEIITAVLWETARSGGIK
ncbi:MAG: hypothetical protein EHM49_03890 [Deltaproteobacteria bacterium]|nr:MAG: hypothetical protein EHM49_03890 [Deltaproteobacteria bacterium]